MNAPTGRHLVSRRTLLAALVGGGIAISCDDSGRPPNGPRLQPYWQPALEVATGALAVLRTLEINSGAFVRGALTPDRFLRSVEAQFRLITDLAELIIPLTPPVDAAVIHASLASAIDALVEIRSAVEGYRTSEQPEQLVHVMTLQQRVRSHLNAFIDGIGPGLAQDGLRKRLHAIGESDIAVWRVPKRAVLVGPYDDEATARVLLANLLDEVIISRNTPGWVEVGRFDDALSADTAAEEWLADGFQVRVEDVTDLTFDVKTIRLPERQSWRELQWLARLDFDPTDLAASELGEQVIAISRSGKVAAFGADGDLRWTRDVRMPLAQVSIHAQGDLLAVHGFDIQLLGTEGNPIWPSQFRPDNQLLEQAIFDDSGLRLVVRSTNASGVGRVFSFDRMGQVWGPTKDYIAAAAVAFHPETGMVAVGSSNSGENQVVLIRPEGNLEQRFGVDGEILDVMFTVAGDHVLLLTNEGVQIFEGSSANPRSSVQFPATVAVRAPHEDVLTLAGETGIASFTLEGAEIWSIPGIRARELYAMKDYVAALVDDLTITVIRNDGVVLGDATTLAPIRGVAVASGLNRLFAVSAERQLQAWQMPGDPGIPEG